MSDGRSGYAVLPSGSAWVLVSTKDGWSHVANGTPPAVPTGGGISLATAGGQLAAGIGPHDQLITSPILTTSNPSHGWSPVELPAGLADSRHAVALDSGVLSAVLTGHGGSVVRRSGQGWATLTTGVTLDGTGRLSLDSISWGAGGLGWLTGHDRAGAAVAFATRDNGRSWTPVPGLGSTAVAALAPCGSGRSWHLPVLAADGSVRVLDSSDAGVSWHAGAAVQTNSGGEPVWGCRGANVWLVGSSGHQNRLFVSADSGSSWRDAGATPTGVTDLAVTDAGTGFAVGRGSAGALLWSVSTDGSVAFHRLALPDWISTIGGTDDGS